MVKDYVVAEGFNTPYERVADIEGNVYEREEVLGKKFTILGKVEDEKLGMMYEIEIEFEDGRKFIVFPEEVLIF